MKSGILFLFTLLVSFQFATTYVLKEGDVELARWTEEDGSDEIQIIQTDEDAEAGEVVESEPVTEEALNEDEWMMTEEEMLAEEAMMFEDEMISDDDLMMAEYPEDIEKIENFEMEKGPAVFEEPRFPEPTFEEPTEEVMQGEDELDVLLDEMDEVSMQKDFAMQQEMKAVVEEKRQPISAPVVPKKEPMVQKPKPVRTSTPSKPRRPSVNYLDDSNAPSWWQEPTWKGREASARPAKRTVRKGTAPKTTRVAPSSGDASEWSLGEPGYQSALQTQSRTGEPVLLYFHAEWSPYCKRFDRDVLSKTKVKDYLAPFVKVKIDGDKEGNLYNQYRVKNFPTFFVRLASGKTIPIYERTTPEFFVKEIQKVTT